MARSGLFAAGRCQPLAAPLRFDTQALVRPGDDMPLNSTLILTRLYEITADGPVVTDLDGQPVVIEIDGQTVVGHPLPPAAGGLTEPSI